MERWNPRRRRSSTFRRRSPSRRCRLLRGQDHWSLLPTFSLLLPLSSWTAPSILFFVLSFILGSALPGLEHLNGPISAGLRPTEQLSDVNLPGPSVKVCHIGGKTCSAGCRARGARAFSPAAFLSPIFRQETPARHLSSMTDRLPGFSFLPSRLSKLQNSDFCSGGVNSH